MLAISDLHGWYGLGHVLQGIDLDVSKGELVSIMGRNGAGKTTTLRCIMGLMPKTAGRIALQGQDIGAVPAHGRLGLGLGFVPEDRRIVAGLTVMENLQLGGLAVRGRRELAQRIDEVLELFPRLRERLKQIAQTLSGGEQQMLAIGRALVSRPAILLLDEPSEGLMPIIVEEIMRLLRRLRDQGLTIVLVEQNVEVALRVSDRAYILDQGRVVYSARSAELLADKEMQERYCAV